MRGFHKSLKASQEKMGAALNAAAASASDSINSQLRRGTGYVGRPSPTPRRTSSSTATAFPPTAARARPEPAHLRRGDDGVAEPDAHLLIGVEHADGLCHRSAFVAIRVVSQFGDLKGVRAHTFRVGGRRRREGRLADHVAHDARPAMRAQTRGRPRRRGLRRVGRHRAVAGVGTMRLERSAPSAPISEDGSTQLTLHRRLSAAEARTAAASRSHHPAQGAARARRSRTRRRESRPVADAQKTIVPRATPAERVERSHAEHEPDEDDVVRPPAERGGWRSARGWPRTARTP